jgi:hypothetical protein
MDEKLENLKRFLDLRYSKAKMDAASIDAKSLKNTEDYCKWAESLAIREMIQEVYALLGMRP